MLCMLTIGLSFIQGMVFMMHVILEVVGEKNSDILTTCHDEATVA